MTTVVATTELPDAQQPTLDASTEDEIGVSWTDVIDNGDYRIQARETGEGAAWGSTYETTVGQATTSDTIASLEDGEEYEVRLRTETEHVTGVWTTAVSATTILPAPSTVTVSIVSDTEIDITWSDDADNEDGYLVLRAQDIYGSWSADQQLADLSAGSTSYTDTTVQPDRKYRYTIRPYTEDTESDATETGTTTGPGYDTKRIPADGWYAEVELPSGEPIQLNVASDALFIPVLNDLPRCRIPVPWSDRWDGTDVDGQPLDVWKDGYHLPIDEIRTVTREEDRAIIHGLGGVELDEYVTDIEYIDKEAHLAAQDVIDTETTYASNVDDPDTDTRSDVKFQEFDTSSEWKPIDDDNPTEPIEQFGGALRTTQTGWFGEAEDLVGNDDQTLTDSGDGNWSGDTVSVMNRGSHQKEMTFTPDHDIPAGELRFAVHYANPDGNPPFTMYIGNESQGVLEDALTTSSDFSDMDWFEMSASEAYSAGESITVEFDVDDTGADFYLDCLYVYDNRASPTLPDGATNTVLQGCSEYPNGWTIELDEVSSVEQVTGARIDSTWSSTVNGQAMAVSNDGGSNWTEVTNSETLDHDFASPSTSLRARLTFGYTTDDPNTSPGVGDAGMEVSLFKLFADLDNTPLVIDKSWRDKVKNILNKIGDAGDFAWEVRRDDGTYSVEWSQVGQRTTDRELDFVEFSGDHTIEESYEKVIVTGASRDVFDERFTFTSGDVAIGLDKLLIVPGSETVYDPNNESDILERQTDYNMRWQEGAIEIIGTGDIQLDKEYAIDYRWKLQGEYTVPGVSDPRTLRVDIPEGRSELECDQLALGIVREIQDPLDEVTATITEMDPRWSLLDALGSPGLPFDGPLEVREFQADNPPIEARLGSRQSVSDAIEEIRDRVESLSGLI